jgi:hypothetical protein
MRFKILTPSAFWSLLDFRTVHAPGIVPIVCVRTQVGRLRLDDLIVTRCFFVEEGTSLLWNIYRTPCFIIGKHNLVFEADFFISTIEEAE